MTQGSCNLERKTLLAKDLKPSLKAKTLFCKYSSVQLLEMKKRGDLDDEVWAEIQKYCELPPGEDVKHPNILKFDREKIKDGRKIRKMTQRELARRLNINQSGMCRLENGQTRAYPATFERISIILDLPIEFFKKG